MKKRNIIFLLLFVFLVSTAYYFRTEINRDSETVELTINYRSKQQEGDYYEVNIETITNDVVGSKAVNSFIEEEVDSFKSNANTQVPELRKSAFSGKYTLDMVIDNYQSDNYISYILKRGEYTGGANTNQITKSFVFNKKEKNKVSLSDIVSESSFMEKLKEKLKRMEKNGDVFPGISEEISLQDIDSFYITNKEVGLLFSKYKVAPGAAGIVEIKLDKESIIN